MQAARVVSSRPLNTPLGLVPLARLFHDVICAVCIVNNVCALIVHIVSTHK